MVKNAFLNYFFTLLLLSSFVPLGTLATLQQFLLLPSDPRDVVASANVIAGFEWPSILMITNKRHGSQFFVRNMIMRAMSRLVWLKTDMVEEINEQEVRN